MLQERPDHKGCASSTCVVLPRAERRGHSSSSQMGPIFRASFLALTKVLRTSQWWKERKDGDTSWIGSRSDLPRPMRQPRWVPCTFRLSCALTFLLAFICRSHVLFYTKVAPEEILLCV